MMLATQTVYGLNGHGMSNLLPNKDMVWATKLERILTRIMGFSGPVENLTQVSVCTNLSQSNEVLNEKEYTPISTLLHPPPTRGKYVLILYVATKWLFHDVPGWNRGKSMYQKTLLAKEHLIICEDAQKFGNSMSNSSRATTDLRCKSKSAHVLFMANILFIFLLYCNYWQYDPILLKVF